MRRIVRSLALVGWLVLVVAGCDDECSSPSDCSFGQACVQGRCTSRGDLGPILGIDSDINEVGPGGGDGGDGGDGDGGDAGDTGDSGPDDDGGDAGDGGAPPDADVVGQVFVRQFARTQNLFASEAGGFVEDRSSANVTVQENDLGVAIGTCRTLEISVGIPPTGVGIDGVDFTVEQSTVETFTLDSDSTSGVLEPANPPLPDRLFTEAGVQITFDFRAGLGSGRPNDVFDLQVPGPSPIAVQTPSTAAPLVINGGVDFIFTPALLPGDRLLARMFDATGQKQLVCDVTALAGTSYFIAQSTFRAFADLNPETPITLHFGLFETQTEDPGVQGGGDARITFEIFRGVRYENVDLFP